MRETWSIIVHGGARTIPFARQSANRIGCLAAVTEAAGVLRQGGGAIDAAVAAVRRLETDPTFNAGFGSVLNADGEVEVDAAIMDGRTLDVGAVAAVKGCGHPIDIARAMLTDRPVLLVGEGAAAYGRKVGAPFCDPADLVAKAPKQSGHDTVGCVVLDNEGNVVAAASTGGLSGVHAGRVGDAPIPGGGLYADNGLGGVAFSGDGESILRLALAARLSMMLQAAPARIATRQAIGQMTRVGGEAGCIAIDRTGRPSFFHNSDHFAVAMASAGGPTQAFLHHSEFNDG